MISQRAVSPLMLPWIRRGVAAAVLLTLAGCANGDFGEVRPSLVSDNVHDWVARDAIAGQPTWTSSFELTDDERLLRDLAYPLIEPPYDRKQWYSVAGEYGAIGGDHRTIFDRTAYTTHLMVERHRSPASRYAKLGDDIRNDIARVPPFFAVAARVIDIDRKRQRSLAYISGLSEDERKQAMRRINENASIVRLVQGWLANRISSYRFALERLVLMTPSPQAVEVERLLNQLQATTHHPARPQPQLQAGLGFVR
jgi:hypothetical protein